MFEELRQQSLQERKYVRHPYISFVLIHNGKYFCIKHPKTNGMNAGSMRGHLRGKAHHIDFETGNSINKIDFTEINKIIKESPNQQSIKSKRELFDDYYYMIPKLYALKDIEAAITIARHVFEGEIKKEVLRHLIILYCYDYLSNQK